MKQENKIKTIYHLDWIYQQIDSMIDLMDERAIQEITSGNTKDLNNIIGVIEEEAIRIFNFMPDPITQDKFYELTNLTANLDESLKILNYNYFKLSMLPGFYLGNHSIEWGNFVQLYQFLNILAARSLGKCFSPDTEVLMFDGSVKQIQDIRVGDLVMGPDSMPREVLSLHSGVDDMYEVEQARSENYKVNSRHLLHFKRGVWNNDKKTTESNNTRIVEMPISEYHEKSKYYKSKSWGYRCNGWELPSKTQEVEPYFLGLWLGDGNNNDSTITNQDDEVYNYLEGYAKRLGIDIRRGIKNSPLNIKITNSIPGERNVLLNFLKNNQLIHNKHIPQDYLINSRENRLQLLAGLIDSDGYYQSKGNMYHICMNNEYLIKQIQQLGWSLGFRCTYRERNCKLSYKDVFYKSFQVSISGNVSSIPVKIKYKKGAVNDLIFRDSFKSSLKTTYIGKGAYVGFSCDKDHLFLLKDGTVVHNSFEFSFAYPLWKMYGYRKPTEFNPIDRQTELRKLGVIVTNKYALGKDLLKFISDEIRDNNMLHERLKPSSGGLGKEEIEARNGAELKLRSYDSSIRGLHPGYISVDDFLGKECMYSKDMRDKYHDVFQSEIMNAIEPDGQVVAVGTPFHHEDLYAQLRRDEKWKMFEYPAIFPNGELAAPNRYNMKLIEEKKKSLGSLIFSREILVVPVSDVSTIFPYSILEKAFVGMNEYVLVDNIHSFPKKFVKVKVGCDFAISGNIGSDASVFQVWGLDQFGDWWLLYVWRGQGKSHNQQISEISKIERNFNPNEIIMEVNGFQRVMAQLAKDAGVRNIVEFTTTSFNKKDVYEGLPSIAVLFEQGRIHMPRGDERSREQTDWLCSEFNAITIKDNGKLESADEHDDGPMSTFFAIKGGNVASNELIMDFV